MGYPLPPPEEAFAPRLSICPICGAPLGKLTWSGSDQGFLRWHTVCDSGDLILLFVSKGDDVRDMQDSLTLSPDIE